ncbi:degenerin unc-8-like isoform X1 [Amphibalanus amphitrite]|uniref:degenerin unc-8-like isoform X1 n=1 Tax=Amphibalanus amphitrite TaxID=1232801 RepID=UPI001C8FB046|nr:degenerin unc-8-like isoform X1 [Amphibalanus amphitrite]
MRFLAHYMALPESVRGEIGLSFEDFIIECSYMGSDCGDQRLFRTVTSPQYGNCYTFNSNVTESEDLYAGMRETSLTGDMFSFSLILNMKEYVYPPSRTASLGARIVVHNPDQVPAVEQSGLNLYPQTTTSVAIDQWSVQRLPLPFEAGCAFGWKEVDYEPYSRINDSSVHEMYSVTRCKSMCLQDALIKTCGCFHPLQAAPEGFRRRGDAAPPVSPPCLLTTESDDLLCVRELFERQNTTCHCPSPCYETGYNAQQSMTMWPRQSYLSTLIGRLKLNFSSLLMEDAERLPQNILELKVFYKTLDVQRILQTPKYSYISLVSSVGGAMSLYLGISLVMVAELFEYLILLAWAVAKFYTKSRQGPRKVQPGAELAENMPEDFGKVPPSYTAETTLYPVPSKALYLPPKSPRALKW